MFSRAMSLGLAVAILLLAQPMSTWGQGQPALPGEKCEVTPDPMLKWSAQEKWAWTEICEGRPANLIGRSVSILLERPFSSLVEASKEWDPRNDQVLGARFLKTILLRAPFREAIPERGVYIYGALFEKELDLSYATIDADLIFQDSRFEAPVSFLGAEFKRNMVFVGPQLQFEKKLNLSDIHTGNSLLLRYGAQFADVALRGAKIDGRLSMVGAKFSGLLDMNGIQIGGPLFMNSTDTYDAEFFDVDLSGAEVGGQVAMEGSKFKGRLNMNGIQAGRGVLMRGAHFEQDVKLSVSIISGGLHFSNGKKDASWGKGATLDLRQGQLQFIYVSEQSLPKKTPENTQPLKLEGLQYQRMVTMGASGIDNSLPAEWYKTHWLEKSEFSSQAYKQLADALVREDRPDVAAEILYASKEQQRDQAEGLRWFNLTLQKYLIGYGYRIYQALFWFGWFVALGALVHLRVKAKPKQGLADLAASLFFSFDRLIPVLELDDAHYKDSITGWRRYYFGAHILIGFVLVSFILAGVSGLTK